MLEGKDAVLLEVARKSVKANLEGRIYQPEPFELAYEPPFPVNGVFVSLFVRNQGEREMRGSIGRHERYYDTIAEEIADCAVFSATEDPRFPPVVDHELEVLEVEISLLTRPVPVEDLDELDPSKIGVVMKSAKGDKMATLLPDHVGVNSVQQQIAALKNKASIESDEDYRLEKFTVYKIE